MATLRHCECVPVENIERQVIRACSTFSTVQLANDTAHNNVISKNITDNDNDNNDNNTINATKSKSTEPMKLNKNIETNLQWQGYIQASYITENNKALHKCYSNKNERLNETLYDQQNKCYRVMRGTRIAY